MLWIIVLRTGGRALYSLPNPEVLATVQCRICPTDVKSTQRFTLFKIIDVYDTAYNPKTCHLEKIHSENPTVLTFSWSLVRPKLQ